MAVKAHELHPPESSVVSLLSGWAQQGVQAFFATQRILLDLAMRQNATVLHAIKEQLSDPHHSPTAILGEVAEEGVENFVKGQKVLLDLGKQQNEILMTGLKERVGECPRRQALVNLLRRSVENYIHMQEQFLQIASKQTHTWVQEAKAGNPYHPEHLVKVAREGLDTFIKAQKDYLDIVAQETAKATKPAVGAGKKMKKTGLSVLARQATESLIEAQKRLVDVAGQQIHSNVKTAGKALELLQPFPFLSFNELTKEVVKSYVDAQKALMEVVSKPKPAGRVRPAGRARRPQAAVA